MSIYDIWACKVFIRAGAKVLGVLHMKDPRCWHNTIGKQPYVSAGEVSPSWRPWQPCHWHPRPSLISSSSLPPEPPTAPAAADSSLNAACNPSSYLHFSKMCACRQISTQCCQQSHPLLQSPDQSKNQLTVFARCSVILVCPSPGNLGIQQESIEITKICCQAVHCAVV